MMLEANISHKFHVALFGQEHSFFFPIPPKAAAGAFYGSHLHVARALGAGGFGPSPRATGVRHQRQGQQHRHPGGAMGREVVDVTCASGGSEALGFNPSI